MLNKSRDGQRAVVHAALQELRQEILVHPVVGIDEEQVTTPGRFDADIAGRTDPAVGFADDPDAVVAVGIAVADCRRGVAAAVVHQQQLEVGEPLGKQAVQALGQVSLHVIDRDDDGYEHRMRMIFLRGNKNTIFFPISIVGSGISSSRIVRLCLRIRIAPIGRDFCADETALTQPGGGCGRRRRKEVARIVESRRKNVSLFNINWLGK